jgi:putative phage-type endonuclease
VRTVNVIQGSAAWLQARVGLLTASRFGDIMAKPKRGTAELACRRDYRMELICERLTSRAGEHYVSREMDFGSDNEPFARTAYEVGTGSMVDEVGLVMHPTLDFAAASPDGLVDDDGCIEIKVPKTSTHIEWKLADVVPEEHIPQMMWVMACCEREYCDFVSFDPRLPLGLRFFVKRLERDEKLIAEMEYAAIEFNAEIEAFIAKLGAPPWEPKLPAPRSEGFVAYGGLSVPADIDEMLQGEIMP